MSRTDEDKQAVKEDYASLRQDMRELREDLTEITRHLKGWAKSGAKEGADTVAQKLNGVGEHAREATDDVERRVREHPLQACAIAAGVGFLAGILSRR